MELVELHARDDRHDTVEELEIVLIVKFYLNKTEAWTEIKALKLSAQIVHLNITRKFLEIIFEKSPNNLCKAWHGKIVVYIFISVVKHLQQIKLEG